MNFDIAEKTAVQALAFMGSDPERWSRFSAQTGIRAEDVRSMAAETDFLAGVLAYLLKDDSLLMVFCSHNSLDPAQPARAHAALSGMNNQESFGL